MDLQPTHIKQYLSRQRIAVAMEAAGGKSDQNISRHNRLGVENFLPFDDANDETRQIISSLGKITRMLTGFAPDQHTARLTTPCSNSPHNHPGDIDIKLAADKVIQEEKRLGAWVMISFTPIATRSMPTV